MGYYLILQATNKSLSLLLFMVLVPIKTLKTILTANLHEGEISQMNFKQYTDGMSNVDVDSEEIKSYGGFKGVNALADRFISSLSEKGLL